MELTIFKRDIRSRGPCQILPVNLFDFFGQNFFPPKFPKNSLEHTQVQKHLF